MTQFNLDKAIYENAIANPYRNSAYPGRAALGRAGEPGIVQEFVKSFPEGHIYIRCGNPIPDYFSAEYCHDGCLFDENYNIVAVIEAKMDFRGKVVISSNSKFTTEVDTLEYCIDNNIPYYLAIGEHIEGMKGQYIGSVRITKEHINACERLNYGYEFNTRTIGLK